MKKKLTLVISAYNAEDRLEKTVKTVPFAEEVIIINNSSEDNTETVAKKITPLVFTRPNNPMLNVNKNFLISKATGEWVLYLDDDERLSETSQEEIQSVIKDERLPMKDSPVNGYWIPRKNIIFGKWIEHSLWWPDYQLRLLRNGTGKFPEKHVHEAIAIDGLTEKLKQPMIHDSYKTINEYLFKLTTLYTDNEAKALIDSGKKLAWHDAISMPVDDFLKTFFLQKGYKDGLHGLVLSMLQAFYSLVVFAKVWEKQGFAQHTSPHFPQEVHTQFNISHYKLQYWFFTACMENAKSTMKKNYFRVLRKRVASKIK